MHTPCTRHAPALHPPCTRQAHRSSLTGLRTELPEEVVPAEVQRLFDTYKVFNPDYKDKELVFD